MSTNTRQGHLKIEEVKCVENSTQIDPLYTVQLNDEKINFTF